MKTVSEIPLQLRKDTTPKHEGLQKYEANMIH